MRLIDKIFEPEYVSVCWQGIENTTSGDVHAGRKYIVGKVVKVSDDSWRLEYIENLPKPFTDYYSFMSVNKKIFDNIYDALIPRLPPKSRGDFGDFLKDFLLEPSLKDEISYFSLLAYTGGRLPGDGFSFVHPLVNIPFGNCFAVEAAGFRHCEAFGMKDNGSLFKDLPAFFEREPDNEYDPNYAVKIMVDINGKKTHLGYIGKVQNEAFTNWINSGCTFDAYVAKIKVIQNRVIPYIMVKVLNKG